MLCWEIFVLLVFCYYIMIFDFVFCGVRGLWVWGCFLEFLCFKEKNGTEIDEGEVGSI